MTAHTLRGQFSTAWPRLWPILALAALGTIAALARRGRDASIGPAVARCPIHGISYDTELEMCPDCAKTPSAVLKGLA